MKFSFIDKPYFVAPETYQKAIDSMLYRLEITSGVASVYQVGGVHTPGISDLDLVVVFNQGVSCKRNFLDNLKISKEYLFIHALYGTNENMFIEAQQYTFFHKYKLLYGNNFKIGTSANREEEKLLKRQIALEFLLKMYIVMTVQRCYRIIKLRALLLEAKAIQYDLEFLGIDKGNLAELVYEVIDMREKWFEKKSSDHAIGRWFENFYKELEKFLNEYLSEERFFSPGIPSFHMASNIRVASGDSLHWKRNGFRLPWFATLMEGKKVFNLHHRFNSFQFSFPMTNENIPPVIGKRFELMKQMLAYNKNYLPYFLPLSSSLKMF